MNQKELSIVTAAYNAEKTIRNTLESCLDADLLNNIEIIIIDDGSTDTTGAIADEYSEKYPQCVKVIHKENGGYGSAVNEGMKCASGKYFKLLDADDSFDADGLVTLVNKCKEIESDIVLTKVEKENCSTGKKEILGKWRAFYDVDSNILDRQIDDMITMHMLCVKVALLKENLWFELPSRIHYSDSLYTLHVLSLAKSISALDVCLYKYNVGNVGQSMSAENLIKNVDQYDKILRTAMGYFMGNINDDKKHKKYIMNQLNNLYSGTIEILMHMKRNKIVLDRIIKMENWLASKDNKLNEYIGIRSKKVFLLRKTRYIGYWIVGGIIMNIINPLGK